MSTTANQEGRRGGAVVQPKELRASAYDSVASLLIALLIFVGFFVGLMFIVWLTGQLLFTKAPIPVELVDFSGRGDHAEGFERDMLEPGLEEMEEMIEPQVEATLQAVTDVVTSQAAAFDTIQMAATSTSAGQGGMGDSRGPGPLGDGRDDIIPPWDRWEIQFATTGLNVYAQQLDAFGIELGTAGGGKPDIDYAYNLAKGRPDTRKGPSADEKRLYMTWQKGASRLADFDRQLLQKAGISTNRRLVLQFYPRDTEIKLLTLEAEAGAAKGKKAQEFLKTIFGVQSARGGGYEFFIKQQYFRPAPAS